MLSQYESTVSKSDVSTQQVFTHKNCLATVNQLRLKLFEIEPPTNNPSVNSSSNSKLQENYGVAKTDFELAKSYMLLVFTISGAYGELTPAEVGFIIQKYNALDLTAMLGGPEKANELQEIATNFVQNGEFKTAKITELAQNFQENVKRMQLPGNGIHAIVYDTLMAFRADGNYKKPEKLAIEKAATEIGVSEQSLKHLQSLAKIETELNGAPTPSDISKLGAELDVLLQVSVSKKKLGSPS